MELPGWSDAEGIHPTKVEVYAEPATLHPQNIQVCVWPWGIETLDTEAFLQETSSYLLAPEADFTHFAVSQAE